MLYRQTAESLYAFFLNVNITLTEKTQESLYVKVLTEEERGQIKNILPKKVKVMIFSTVQEFQSLMTEVWRLSVIELLAMKMERLKYMYGTEIVKAITGVNLWYFLFAVLSPTNFCNLKTEE